MNNTRAQQWKPERQTPSWGERARAMRNLPPFLSSVWEASPGYTVLIILLRLARAFVPVMMLWVGKLIVDAVVTSARTGDPDWRRLAELVALELGITIGAEIAARASAVLEALLGSLFSNRISIRLMEHAASLDLRHFEDSVFYDRLERARRQTAGGPGLITQLLGMGQSALTLVTLAGTLLAFNPLLFLLLFVTVIPAFLGENHYASLGYALQHRRTPERRRLDYYRYVGASDVTAKEVKLFGISPKLVEQYRELAESFHEESRKLSIRRNIAGVGFSLISSLGYYAAYGTIIYQTALGVLSLGDLTLLSGSFARARDLMQGMLSSMTQLYEQALNLDDLFHFFALQPTIIAPADPAPVPNPIRIGFEFRDVWFRYPVSGGETEDAETEMLMPRGDWKNRGNLKNREDRKRAAENAGSVGGSTKMRDAANRLAAYRAGVSGNGENGEEEGSWILRGVNLHIRPGERWALVGENGAGKTTLVKLLLRLYEPSRGEILLDGLPLSAYDPADYHRQVSVIFQDFVRFDMVAEENITLDRPFSGEETPPPEVMEAAERALAAPVIEGLPHRYGTMLGRRFEGGVELSGGQWQKVALARSYLRDAQLLILDEPTAALDARAEYEVFSRFVDLTRGKIAVLISHRFSTVRMADHILVLENGRVLEEGGHNELIAAGGRYAELFGLQAAGYR
ncbi:MAG: ABC transporter ATP-binding protein/permease [Gemmatimonadota bacterium]|nr:ABC transporter ATP-binding protein/permease [Gemmatimonadota bacterium]